MRITPTPAPGAPSRRAPRLPLALFAVGIFCLFAFLSQRDIRRLHILRVDGVTGRATITGLWQRTRGGKRSFGVYYRFEAGGHADEGVRSVPESYHSRAKVGDLMLVTYLPADPKNHYVGRVDDSLLAARRSNKRTGLGIVAGVSCVFLLLAASNPPARPSRWE
jgi:hypothetical protein